MRYTHNVAAGSNTPPGEHGPADPDLANDVAVRVIGRLFALAPRFVDLAEMGAREYGLGYARGRLLWALHASGPLVMRALSQAIGVSPRTVTGLVDALEADGWVRRLPHPTDRRATIVTLTPPAQAAFTRILAHYRDFSRDLMADVPEADQVRMLELIGHITARLDGAVARAAGAFAADPPVTAPARSQRSGPEPGGGPRPGTGTGPPP
jgi:DNA-binding MarR family transcriptional regulator